jgi:hypothetical protein
LCTSVQTCHLVQDTLEQFRRGVLLRLLWSCMQHTRTTTQQVQYRGCTLLLVSARTRLAIWAAGVAAFQHYAAAQYLAWAAQQSRWQTRAERVRRPVNEVSCDRSSPGADRSSPAVLELSGAVRARQSRQGALRSPPRTLQSGRCKPEAWSWSLQMARRDCRSACVLDAQPGGYAAGADSSVTSWGGSPAGNRVSSLRKMVSARIRLTAAPAELTVISARAGLAASATVKLVCGVLQGPQLCSCARCEAVGELYPDCRCSCRPGLGCAHLPGIPQGLMRGGACRGSRVRAGQSPLAHLT